MKELKDAGQKIVGTYCSFVPTELVEAAGGTVVSLCASSEEPILAAEANLPRNLCPLIKASYGFGLTDTCPYFYFSDFIADHFTLPTGWNGKETAGKIYTLLAEKGYTKDMRCIATGYGRVSVDYADKVVTEITCHGKGACATVPISAPFFPGR